MDTTTNSTPPARLFELTRTMGLHSRLPTGIDRVCLAYMKALCAAPEPVYGIVRTVLGYVLLDDDGMQEILARLEGRTPWGEPDFLSKLLHKPDWYKHYTEAELRRLCIARCRPRFVKRMLRKHLPEGTAYINVDHSNMTTRMIKAAKAVPGGTFVPFMHDTIPLDFPEYQTSKIVIRFGQMLKRVQAHADIILCNSQVSADDVTRHMEPLGKVPPIYTAHLGIESDYFQSGHNEPAPDLPKPYFVVLGTIEPRKNHKLLLDIWEELEKELPAGDMPALVICGRRGWMNEDVFARMDNSPQRGRYLFEFNDLTDNQIKTVLRGSAGSLFPSFTEGFGLPPAESAALGAPVVCHELPVYREFLGDIPIYANVSDSYAWKKAIIELAQQAQARGDAQPSERKVFVPPSWEEHFDVVLKVT